jgi:hypothetical protein
MFSITSTSTVPSRYGDAEDPPAAPAAAAAATAAVDLTAMEYTPATWGFKGVGVWGVG